MTAEHYHALHSWMDAHPTAKRCVVALDRWLPLIPFVCYPVLLCLLNVRLFRLLGSQRQAALDLTAVIARTVFVPGLTFWGGTILRDRLNLPRPYEQPGFEPLRHKETRGTLLPLPPRAERFRAGHGMDVFLPEGGLGDGGHHGAHLCWPCADRRAPYPRCRGRSRAWLCFGLCGHVAAVKQCFAGFEKENDFCIFCLTEWGLYGIILLAACADTQLPP